MNKIKINKIKLNNIAIIFIIAIFFILDRCFKKIAISFDGEWVIVKNLLSFKFAANHNIAFSLPLSIYITLPLTLLIIIGLITWLILLIKKRDLNHLSLLSLLLIILGALSNLIDRFQLKYVIDYLNIKDFSILNLADVMISLGAFLYLLKLSKKN
ncbi:hypothetical protein EOL94_04250 [bacterium]|nr:signal peptidase II [Patescibacteria group bacterium]MDD3777827.1 signal peptidase II [Patescibacteria group bacterium]MDD3939687.1 signal peptidase II [Patescibacteria group bacterium]MDD4443573.1 signal peptidase II [Patescibacteria group bacterium]NCD01277.1 hypothetical protein [bacterium]